MTRFLKTIAVAYFLTTSTGLHPAAGPPLVEGARILAIAPVAAKSRWNFMRGILHALTDHGHHVTAFTPYPDGDRENYTEVDLSGWLKYVVNVDYATVRDTMAGYGDITRLDHDLSESACTAVYGHDAMKRIIAAVNFDVVFVEFLASECVAHASTALRVPLVYVVPPPWPSFADRALLGHVPHPAAVSHAFVDQAVPRTFTDRLTNVAATVYTACLLQYLAWRRSSTTRAFHAPVAAVKPSLVFVNTHYITDASRPLPPVVVPIGGIHLRPPRPVPADILEFLDNSPHGVILFSLGSVISVSNLPKHIHDVVINSLGQFPQRVLLKYESELKNKPNNVRTEKWIPQRDVLMHPNLKLFISHGGISGVYEAVDAGVPVLGFPVFFDQPRNLQNLVHAGMAVSLDLSSVSKETFVNSVKELIYNEKYRKNAMIASERFKDRPMTPQQAVNYWTTYVIRHNGAPHLKSHALNLTWYQYFLLDVIAALLLMFVLVVYITVFIHRSVHRYFVLKCTLNKSKFKSK